jgi:putative restriction endonuclease
MAVITAYNGRCALSGLPEPLLLDAAHIVADTDEQFGQPVVSNGIPLSKIHHAAFDAHLIGIDSDYRLHVSDRLLAQNDGPMLEALKRLHGNAIHCRTAPRIDLTEIDWRCASSGSSPRAEGPAARQSQHQAMCAGLPMGALFPVSARMAVIGRA